MIRKLFTLAYPALTPADRALIDAFRILHDPNKVHVVDPHFTLIFGSSRVDDSAYMDHVRGIAAITAPVRFHCRYAMLGAEDGAETAYVFLVPDEGYSALSLLHDRLYSGPLARCLRLDLMYVPHITIGTCARRHEAKELCDTLNAQRVSIEGTIENLTVAALANEKTENLRSFRLGISL